MITGDAEDTAVAVASAVGFYDPSHHRTLSGAEIEHMSTSELEVLNFVDLGTNVVAASYIEISPAFDLHLMNWTKFHGKISEAFFIDGVMFRENSTLSM